MNYLFNLGKQSIQPFGPLSNANFWSIIFINYCLMFFVVFLFGKYGSFLPKLAFSLIFGAYTLIFLYISIVCSRRRLHDAGFSSLWLLLIILGTATHKYVSPENYNGFIFFLECLGLIPVVMFFFSTKLINNKYRLS